ncbi:concanavalin A-like lectin/glucanase domain-containing protein [Massariosphaeria phaeospora]|uniref:Concanavalin A-like lectin/glucanase domain-containing protein n=1 Tax=Massariosphaeria phaeospora TaxID=100035 RepID=A0A7C8MXC4_9PLEO|nr:concanavalin A-like lectin/glucanase domain-containing protein [Massariosphaeria phaeospora]
MYILVFTAALLPAVSTATTLIPKTVFDSTANLEQYFTYNYPWGGNTHNGAARMDKAHVAISSPGTLTITAQPVKGQPPATHGGKQLAINYLAGAIGAKQHFTVPKGGGFVFSGSFQATTTKGTWPAFWLTAVNGWPPEIDMAEWKGSGKISFNTFNTSSVLSWKDVQYNDPAQFHDIKCELRDKNGKDTQVKFWMDGKEIATHVGKDYTGKPFYLVINLQMEGSSGKPGPTTNTTYSVRNLEVTTL